MLGRKVDRDDSVLEPAANGNPVLASTYRITLEDLEQAMRFGGIDEITPGDVVLIRTGWNQLLHRGGDGFDPAEVQRWGAAGGMPGIYLATASAFSSWWFSMLSPRPGCTSSCSSWPRSSRPAPPRQLPRLPPRRARSTPAGRAALDDQEGKEQHHASSPDRRHGSRHRHVGSTHGIRCRAATGRPQRCRDLIRIDPADPARPAQRDRLQHRRHRRGTRQPGGDLILLSDHLLDEAGNAVGHDQVRCSTGFVTSCSATQASSTVRARSWSPERPPVA